MKPRFQTVVERWYRRVATASGTAVDVALDEGFVLAGDERLTIAKLQVLWREGPRSGLFDVAADMLSRGGARLAF
jgi:inorganic triphosphatase YgiF